MLEIDEVSLNAINSSIDEAMKLINEKKDIRIVSSMVSKVGNKIRAMYELRETPDNAFVSFVFSLISGTVVHAFEDKEDKWFAINKDLCDECLHSLKNLLQGIKVSFKSKNFEEAVTVLKASVFTLLQVITRMSD
jgi:hypothetical protein